MRQNAALRGELAGLRNLVTNLSLSSRPHQVSVAPAAATGAESVLESPSLHTLLEAANDILASTVKPIQVRDRYELTTLVSIAESSLEDQFDAAKQAPAHRYSISSRVALRAAIRR